MSSLVFEKFDSNEDSFQVVNTVSQYTTKVSVLAKTRSSSFCSMRLSTQLVISFEYPPLETCSKIYVIASSQGPMSGISPMMVLAIAAHIVAGDADQPRYLQPAPPHRLQPGQAEVT